MRGVSAGFLRIPGSLRVAEETYRRQEYLVSSRCVMATIKVRKQVNGTTRYTAIVRVRKGKTIVHREAKTFAHRAAALTWAKHREVTLEDPGALARAEHGAPT